MRIRIVMPLSALLLISLLAGCAGPQWEQAEDGMTLELKAGETKMIAFDTHGGVPYIWEHEGFDPQIVMVGDAEYHSSSKAPKPGGPVKAVFGIRGLKAGQTEITFVYRHVGDKSTDETRIITVVVE